LARSNFATPGFNNPALNYYNLVRPQFTFQAGIMNLHEQQIYQASQTNAIEGDIASALTTGHRFGYFTHTRYFLNHRTLAGLGGGGTGARTTLTTTPTTGTRRR
jgi:hypothetical protein